MSRFRIITTLSITSYNALFVSILFIAATLSTYAQQDRRPLSEDEIKAVQETMERMVTDALDEIESKLVSSLEEVEEGPSRDAIKTALDAIEFPDPLFNPAQQQSTTSPTSKTNVVWCWIDNNPFDDKYKPCFLPFLGGEVPPYETPLTASRSLQQAIDQASELAVNQKRPIPLIVLPSFLPEILRIITLGICGDDNYEGYVEQVQMKPGVILIGVPLLLDQVKIISPADGPTVNAASLFGDAVTLEDVLDDVGVKLEDMASDIANKTLDSAVDVLGQRFEKLLGNLYNNTLGDIVKDFAEGDGPLQQDIESFLEDSFNFLDDKVVEAANLLGEPIDDIAPVATLFTDDFGEAENFRTNLTNKMRQQLSQWVTGKGSPGNATGELIIKNARDNLEKGASAAIGAASQAFTDGLKNLLQVSKPVPDKQFKIDVKSQVKSNIFDPLTQQLKGELTGAIDSPELSFIPSELRDLIEDKGIELAESLLKDVADEVSSFYQQLAVDANAGLTSVLQEVFGGGGGTNVRNQILGLSGDLGNKLGNQLGDAMEAGLSDVVGEDSVFGQLVNEFDVDLAALEPEALQLLESVGTESLNVIASKTLNVGLIFGTEITHRSGLNGPGVFVDGALLTMIWNSIEDNAARGGLTQFSLPEDGAVGGGVVVQGIMPTIFIFNEIEGNYALLDGGGVYFDDTYGSVWVFNSIEDNRAERNSGGVHFTEETVMGFFFNDVEGNSANLGGGCYLVNETVLLFGNSFSGNRSATHGGGLAIVVDGILIDNSINGNSAFLNGGGVAINSGGDPILRSNSISNNFAMTDGGGVAVFEAGSDPLIVSGNSISGNFTSGRGGGIFVDGLAEPEINGNRINGNFALNSGGGVYWASPVLPAAKADFGGATTLQVQSPLRPPLIDNTISNNTTPGFGGGVALIEEHVPLNGNRISGNQATQDGGGVYIVNVHQATLQGNSISGNRTETLGGGLRLDRVALTQSASDFFSSNSSAINGGGIASTTAQSIAISGGGWHGDVTVQRGGGVWIENVSQVSFNGSAFIGNQSQGEGGGLYAHLVDTITITGVKAERNVAASDGNPAFGLGRGGGFAMVDNGTVTITGSSFIDNGASGDGGGIYNDSIGQITIQQSGFVSNLADMTLGSGPVPDPRGGGGFFTDIGQLTISNSSFTRNRADWGGGVSLLRCPDVVIQSSRFEGNATDTDEDGFGDGGGGLAEGPDTFVLIGGDINGQLGNTFINNIAGSPAPIIRRANGGAFAIETLAHADIFGNTFEGNSCTYTGGALYVAETSPQTRIGRAPDDPSQDFRNFAIQNCVQQRIDIDEFEIPPRVPPPPETFCYPRIICIDQPVTTDLIIQDSSLIEPSDNIFSSVSPGQLAISAVAVPGSGQFSESGEASVSLNIAGGEAMRSDSLTSSAIVNYEGGELPFSVTIEPPAGQEEPQAPSLGLEVVQGGFCSPGSALLGITAKNLPDDQIITGFSMIVTITDMERYVFEGFFTPNSQSQLVFEHAGPQSYAVSLFGDAPLDLSQPLFIANIVTLAPTTAETIPSPINLQVEAVIDGENNAIELITELPDPFISCPEDVPFIPEVPCEEYELWVTVRKIEELDRAHSPGVASGTGAYLPGRSRLVLGHLDTDGGPICPPLTVIGQQKGSETDSFNFSVSAGQVIDATVNLLAYDIGDSTPEVVLRDITGATVAADDVNPATDIVSFASIEAAFSGIYSIDVITSPGDPNAYSGVYLVDVIIDGETAVQQSGCSISSSPLVDEDNGEISALFSISWPDDTPQSSQNAFRGSLTGNASQSAPPWPFDFEWKPRPAVSFDFGADAIELPRPDTPRRVTGNGVQGEIITWRGGFLGIVRAPDVIVDANVIDGNYAEAYGGGGFITVTNESVRIGLPDFGNIWTKNQSTFGGGIAVQNATPVLQNNRIGEYAEPNLARYGAGLFLDDSHSLVGGAADDEVNWIVGNVAGFNIQGDQTLPVFPDAALTPETIASPSEAYEAVGGGVFIRAGSPEFRNNQVLNNSVSTRNLGSTINSQMYRMGGGGIASTRRSNALIVSSTIMNNQVKPLPLDISDALNLHLFGGGVLVDDSIYPAKDEIESTSIFLNHSIVNNNRIEFAIASDSARDATELQMVLSGGGVAARKAGHLVISSATLFDNRISRDDSTGNVSDLPKGRAMGGGVSIEDDSIVHLNKSVILRPAIATYGQGVIGQGVIGHGGGIAVDSATSFIDQIWLLDSRSSHNGGALYIKDASGGFERSTIAGAIAVQQGSSLFIEDRNPPEPDISPFGEVGFSIVDNIIESFGSSDSSAVHLEIHHPSPPMIESSTPILFGNNNVVSAFGRIFSGSYEETADSFNNIHEFVRFADPDSLDYAIGSDSESATASRTSGPLGWNPNGLHPLPAPRVLNVTSDYLTLADAVASSQYGDRIVVESGTYEEQLTVPHGVWIQSVSGPLETVIKQADDMDPPRSGIDAHAPRHRSIVSGFSVLDYKVGVETTTRSGILIANVIVNSTTSEFGIDIVDNPNAPINPYAPILAESSIRFVTTGVRILGETAEPEERDPIYCRFDFPIPLELEPPPIPWIHHLAIADTKDGILWVPPATDPDAKPERIPIMHNVIYVDGGRGGDDYVNLPDLSELRFNLNTDPSFIDDTVIPMLASILAAENQPDLRRIGALEPQGALGDLNDDGFFDARDLLIQASLIAGRIAVSDLLIEPNTMDEVLLRSDWNADGMLTADDLGIGMEVFVGKRKAGDTPLAQAMEGGQE